MCQSPTGVFPVAPVETWTTLDHAPVVDLEQHLLRLVDLEVVPVAVARVRRVRALQSPPDVRRDAARAGEAVQLLEGDDRVGGVVRVEAVDPAGQRSGAGRAVARGCARSGRERQRRGRAGRRSRGPSSSAAEGAGGRDGDPDDVVGDPLRAEAEVDVIAEGPAARARGPSARCAPSSSPSPLGLSMARSVSGRPMHSELAAARRRARGGPGRRRHSTATDVEVRRVGGGSALLTRNAKRPFLSRLRRAQRRSRPSRA